MAEKASKAIIGALGHSEAEQAFQPWWDTVEDFLVYGLIMLGLVVFPTTMFSSTPLDCTICNTAAGNCADMMGTKGYSPITNKTMDESRNAWWVKKFCTMTAVPEFTLYFPYVLLTIPFIMVGMEKGFVKIFKAGMKLESFYNLLVKEITTTGNDSTTTTEQQQKTTVSIDMENRRDVIEMSQKFRDKSNFYKSYLWRTIFELLIVVMFLVWLCAHGLPVLIQDQVSINCDVYGTSYECSGHPQSFYLYILVIVIACLVLYLFCAIYNIIWITCPNVSKLSNLMNNYRTTSTTTNEQRSTNNALQTYYYKNKDLKLLLDLLAEHSGIGASLRVLALFDKNLNKSFKPGDIDITFTETLKRNTRKTTKNVLTDDGGKFKQEEEDVYDLKIKFTDAPAFNGLLSHMKDMSFMYTIELFPPTQRTSVIPLMVEKDEINGDGIEQMGDSDVKTLRLNDIESTTTLVKGLGRVGHLMDLKFSQEYSIRVSTILNGKTLAHRTEWVGPIKPKTS